MTLVHGWWVGAPFPCSMGRGGEGQAGKQEDGAHSGDSLAQFRRDGRRVAVAHDEQRQRAAHKAAAHELQPRDAATVATAATAVQQRRRELDDGRARALEDPGAAVLVASEADECLPAARTQGGCRVTC